MKKKPPMVTFTILALTKLFSINGVFFSKSAACNAESSRNLFGSNIYHSTLAASTPNKLFSEMLKISKIKFFKEIFFCEGK